MCSKRYIQVVKPSRQVYSMQMTFGRMSEPLTKVQKVDSTKTAQSYDFTYRYEDDSHPTAPTQVGHDHYTYDANGFLVRGELVPGQGSKLYRLSTDELPYAACVQLISSPMAARPKSWASTASAMSKS